MAGSSPRWRPPGPRTPASTRHGSCSRCATTGWFAHTQRTTEDYFVGGRRMNWLAIGLSLFATSFSPLSFVGLPREAAYADYHLFLAILFIPLFVMPVVAWLYVPLYHRLQVTSA